MQSRCVPGAKLLLIPALLGLLAGCSLLTEREQAPDQRALLVGQLWVADEMAGQPVAAAPRITVAFYGDRRLVGKAGCNTYTGRYQIAGNTLQISALAAGKAACAADIVTREQSYLATLAAAATYEVRPDALQPGGALFLTGADGKSLRFHRDTTETVQLLNYGCDDGTALRVIFDWTRGTASVSANGANATTLAKAPAMSGFRFEAAPQSFTGEGNDAQWSAAGGTPIACKVVS